MPSRLKLAEPSLVLFLKRLALLFLTFCLSGVLAVQANANPIIIELLKGAAYGVGASAGKEVYENLRNPAQQPRTIPTVPVRPPSPPNGLILNVQNQSGDAIAVQFYSVSRRGHTWPDVTRAYLFHNGSSETVRLGCVPGERICYGAWSRGKYWGTGHGLRHSCTNCCRACGSDARGVTFR